MGYYDSRTDKLNTFGLLIVDRSDTGTAGDVDIRMTYDQVQWETGEASGGSDGLGGTSAYVGYSNGAGTTYNLTGSGTNGYFLDNASTGLVHNSNKPLSEPPGTYVFTVRNGTPSTASGSISGTVSGPGGTAVDGAPVQACTETSDSSGTSTRCGTATTRPDGDLHRDARRRRCGRHRRYGRRSRCRNVRRLLADAAVDAFAK